MGSGVFVTYAREEGPDDARRLAGVLEPIVGPGAVVLAAPSGDGGGGGGGARENEAIERCEVVVALIGPGWRAADDDLAAELARAFAHRLPVIAMLLHRASMPSREALPAQLGPLLDNHPRLTLEMPSDFYWDVTTSHLGRWIMRILDEVRRRERELAAAGAAAQKAGRERTRTRGRLAEAQAAAAAAAGRLEATQRALGEAAGALEARRRDSGEGRTGPGLRVFISYRPETGGDVRTLERDLRERLDGARLTSSEPIPDTADPAAVARAQIARADTVLAVIGPRWAGPAEGATGPRLDAGDDPVRLELEAALARGLPVIPVLTQHAPMPPADALPDSLHAIAAERAYELIVAFWNDGIADLVERLEGIEDGLRRSERALEEAVERHARLEREQREAHADEAKAQAAIRAAQEREQALEDELRRAGEEEERLRHEPRDTNRAYQDGPGPITLEGSGGDGAAAVALDPRRRVLLGAVALLVVIVIIIVVVSR